MRVADLRQAAVDTLTGNWTGAVTLPSRAQYPHQWSWDSAFIAVGLAEVSQERAQRELLNLFGAQWDIGRLPHIVYNDDADAAYFPGPGFWASDRMSGAPSVSTSGIVQPPVHARAALTVATRDEHGARDFLAEAYPKLAAQHRYLIECRDVARTGLACVVHPWESGMDNSPAWDPMLADLDAARPRSFVRRDLSHVPATERPSDADYIAYVSLAESYRDIGYDDGRLPPNTRSPSRTRCSTPCCWTASCASPRSRGGSASTRARTWTPPSPCTTRSPPGSGTTTWARSSRATSARAPVFVRRRSPGSPRCWTPGCPMTCATGWSACCCRPVSWGLPAPGAHHRPARSGVRPPPVLARPELGQHELARVGRPAALRPYGRRRDRARRDAGAGGAVGLP